MRKYCCIIGVWWDKSALMRHCCTGASHAHNAANTLWVLSVFIHTWVLKL
jgi:hypothetical protein